MTKANQREGRAWSDARLHYRASTHSPTGGQACQACQATKLGTLPGAPSDHPTPSETFSALTGSSPQSPAASPISLAQ